MLPLFKEKVLTLCMVDQPASTRGIMGSPNCVPGEGEYTSALQAVDSGFLYMGLSRFAAYVPPAAVTSKLDLRRCSGALLLDGVNNAAAAGRQARLDAKKYPDERALEEPMPTAALLMMRGVRCVATNTTATTSWANMELAQVGMR